jgi:alpha-ketoglutarate-dependent taurine dioxygenase
MENLKSDTSKFDRFKRIKPKAVRMPGGLLVKTGHLDGDERLPLVLQPDTENVDLVEWASRNRDFLEARLLEDGALLFRDFNLNPIPDFESFALALCPELFKDNGEHPRGAISSNVYTPIFYPADRKVLWHNENSFNHRWPLKVWFGCIQPSRVGGETPVVDSRQVFALMDQDIREQFVKRQVMYVRNYGEGLGLDWQTVFKTAKRAEVEKMCGENFVEFEWKKDGGLKTRSIRPAVVKHPQTGEMCWFTQAQHWHPSCLDAATRQSLYSLYGEEDLPRACYYGDGSQIEDAVMDEILSVYAKLEVSFRWQPCDILMLDNVLTAHARNPYAGERKLLVAMGEMHSYTEV